MLEAELVIEKSDRNDGRKNMIALTTKGKSIAIKIKEQYLDVDRAIEEALDQTGHNLWKAMSEFEYLLDQKSLLNRVVEQRK
jgi:DNA-binding MarR family transcriptional regulator